MNYEEAKNKFNKKSNKYRNKDNIEINAFSLNTKFALAAYIATILEDELFQFFIFLSIFLHMYMYSSAPPTAKQYY